MLVLSRHKNEEIVIGSGAEAVRLFVVDIRGDKVRLGIHAPDETPVHRREIYDSMVRQGSLPVLPVIAGDVFTGKSIASRAVQKSNRRNGR